MKAIKCDKCGKYEDYGGNLGGSIALTSIGNMTKTYKDKYDFCGVCTKELQEFFKKWWRRK